MINSIIRSVTPAKRHSKALENDIEPEDNTGDNKKAKEPPTQAKKVQSTLSYAAVTDTARESSTSATADMEIDNDPTNLDNYNKQTNINNNNHTPNATITQESPKRPRSAFPAPTKGSQLRSPRQHPSSKLAKKQQKTAMPNPRSIPRPGWNQRSPRKSRKTPTDPPKTWVKTRASGCNASTSAPQALHAAYAPPSSSRPKTDVPLVAGAFTHNAELLLSRLASK
jgi:hypothetical protein